MNNREPDLDVIREDPDSDEGDKYEEEEKKEESDTKLDNKINKSKSLLLKNT